MIFMAFGDIFPTFSNHAFPAPLRPGGGRDDLLGPQLGLLLPSGTTHELHALFARRRPHQIGMRWDDLAEGCGEFILGIIWIIWMIYGDIDHQS